MAQATAPVPNLTYVSYLGRQAVKFSIIGLVVMMVGRTLGGALISYWKATHPPPPPEPTAGFGQLPPIAFPTQAAEDKPVSYVLETATGTTPAFGDRAKVFLLLRSSASLLADQEAKKIAADYGFVFQPQVLDSKTYRWSKSQPLESVLEMNIENYHHSLTTDYLSRPELLAQKSLPDAFSAVNDVKSMLKKVSLLPPDMATAAGETVYMKAVGGALQPAVSFSDADYIQVDLNRNPIDSRYRMFTPKGYQGTVYAIIGGGGEGVDVLHLEYNYQPIDYTQVHTYYIRTSQAAWKLLQAGEGYIVNKGSAEQAVIREVYLGYYDAFEEQDYLQPIYVFEGDDGFLAYVPAVDPAFIQSTLTE